MPRDDVVRTFVRGPAVDLLPERTLRTAAETLDQESIGVAIVRAPHRPGPGTKARGLVSERDIVRAIADGSDPDRTRIDEVMTTDLASVDADASIHEAAALMVRHEIRHLPVMVDDRVIGVVSMRDALEAMLEDDPARP